MTLHGRMVCLIVGTGVPRHAFWSPSGRSPWLRELLLHNRLFRMNLVVEKFRRQLLSVVDLDLASVKKTSINKPDVALHSIKVKKCQSTSDTLKQFGNYDSDAKNKWDFSLVLKVCREFDDVTSVGKLFHVRAAATGNARSPTVDSRVDGDIQCRRRRWPQALSIGNPGDRLRASMDALVYHDDKLEGYALRHRKPVQATE